MDDSSSANLLIIALLLIINAILTIAYAALVNSREATLEDFADDGDTRAQVALNLLNNEATTTLSYRLAVHLMRVTIIIIATVTFIDPINPDPVSVALVIAMGVIALLISGIVPESIGSAYHESSLGFISILRLTVILMIPFATLLLGVSRLLASIFGVSGHVNKVTEEEIMTLVNAGHTGGTIEEDEKAMIFSVLQLDETTARELMTPRPDIVSVDADTDIKDALIEFVDTGFSRIPVYEDNIDNVIGLLFAKDLLTLLRNKRYQTETIKVRDIVRSTYFVPESKRADELLTEMRQRKSHMAIVVDEYGGTSGLVTIENLVEEIVGDILDEYDINEEAEYIKVSDLEYVIDASMDLDDLNEMLDLDLDTQRSDTLGGFIYMMLGRVPSVGDEVVTEDVNLRVRSIDGRRIRKVLVTLIDKASDDETDDTSSEIQMPTDNQLSDDSSALMDAS